MCVMHRFFFQLWFALGKTAAEKAAWRAARGRDLKLVTICPALVTGPGFRRRNSTASIAYLKGISCHSYSSFHIVGFLIDRFIGMDS